jgi:RNA polymerase sigma-70 factor (ECF subfamily)
VAVEEVSASERTLEATSHSLLFRAALGTEDAWARLDRLYRPFLFKWFLAHGVSHADAEELTQEVMRVVFQELKDFAHAGRVGSFRTWLRGVCLNRLLSYRRSRQLRGAAVGGTDFHAQLHEVADSDDNPAAEWDREHDVQILRQMLTNLANDFEQKTVGAFYRLVFDGVPAPQVAQELGMSVGAVYIAKSRVLRRLREEAEGLIDEAKIRKV